MSMMGVLFPVESQACLRVFKDLPAAADERSIKEKEKLNEKLFSLHFPVFFLLLRHRSLDTTRNDVEFCLSIKLRHFYGRCYRVKCIS